MVIEWAICIEAVGKPTLSRITSSEIDVAGCEELPMNRVIGFVAAMLIFDCAGVGYRTTCG